MAVDKKELKAASLSVNSRSWSFNRSVCMKGLMWIMGAVVSLVPRPFEWRRKGLVHTLCACLVTIETGC